MFRSAFAVLALACATPAFAGTHVDVVRITIDQAHVAQLPTNTATIVIGNPAIADVTALKGNAGVVVTGRSYGHTNLIALDAAGAMLDEEEIHVEPVRDLLVVQRGATRESYFCDPYCMPTAALGDDSKVFGDVSGAITAHDTLAKSH